MNVRFFEYLSEKMYNENTLSDIIWAFAQSNKTFMNHFIKFFFSDFDDFDEIKEFKREHANSTHSSRVDFYIKTNKKEYIIEIKIDDKNHHFEQYERDFDTAKLGYIANYKIPPYKDICIPKTWEQLHDYFIQIVTTNYNKKDCAEIKQFLAYLRRVCNIDLKLEHSSYGSFLNEIIHEILKEDSRILSVKFVDTPLSKDKNRFGRYYEIKKSNGEKISIWIGICSSLFYKTLIYIEIKKDLCPELFSYLKKNDNNEIELNNGYYYEKPYWDKDYGGGYCIELKQEFFNSFDNSQDINYRKGILKKFIDEVLTKIWLKK